MFLLALLPPKSLMIENDMDLTLFSLSIISENGFIISGCLLLFKLLNLKFDIVIKYGVGFSILIPFLSFDKISLSCKCSIVKESLISLGLNISLILVFKAICTPAFSFLGGIASTFIANKLSLSFGNFSILSNLFILN